MVTWNFSSDTLFCKCQLAHGHKKDIQYQICTLKTKAAKLGESTSRSMAPMMPDVVVCSHVDLEKRVA